MVFMSDFLCSIPTEALAFGKTILIGEHAAVYGCPAIAIPLRDIPISVAFEAPRQGLPSRWQDVWSFVGSGVWGAVPPSTLARLEQCLSIGVRTVFKKDLSCFRPQKILVRSEIPLGAGMGGSAALSVALLRSLLKCTGALPLTSQEFLLTANAMDCAFHGNASGLDVCAVSAMNPVVFQKGNPTRSIVPGKEFWLLLVDSGERSPTIDMVKKVAAMREKSPKYVDDVFANIKQLTEKSEGAMLRGELDSLGSCMSNAHALLKDLGVSTIELDSLVARLLASGALGAKLTGGGGGGLALGLFGTQPDLTLVSSFDSQSVYCTQVVTRES